MFNRPVKRVRDDDDEDDDDDENSFDGLGKVITIVRSSEVLVLEKRFSFPSASPR